MEPLTVTREIRIDAAPATVRREILDPARRGRWLDDDRADPVPDESGAISFTGDGGTHVRIVVEPDGEGSRVRVTEEAQGPPVDGAVSLVARPSHRPPVGLRAA